MIFHLIFSILFAGFILIRVVYHLKAKASRSAVELAESRLNMAVRAFLGLGYIGLLVAFVFFPAILGWAAFSLPAWLRWAGGGITLLSTALIWWVQWALDVQFNTTLHIQAGHQLITHGPYHWVRHPMYTALFIMGIGWLLLTANWFVGVPLLAGIGAIVFHRVRAEEELLVKTFGDPYIAYMYRTGRFLPRILHR
jgi:protein-S-isoprenylcysteine O-methyltransferase Ste14